LKRLVDAERIPGIIAPAILRKEDAMKKNLNTALVIDGRTRQLSAFVASVTQAQSDDYCQLVLRHALAVDFANLPGSRPEMPVILMGEYAARSSAGVVAVRTAANTNLLWSEEENGYRKVLVVGGLGPAFGQGGLRVLNVPISATLVRGPVEIEKVAGAGNSNCATADATWSAVNFLVSTDHKAVFLVEGQSDYTYVVRFRSAGEEGDSTEFPAEHRAEMFSRL
jgi:hypothetical protein